MTEQSAPDDDKRDLGDTVGRNAAFGLLAQLTGAVFTAALTLYLVRKLGSSGFGVFSLALGIAGFVLLPSDFGISASAARFVAEHRGDRERVAAVVADSLRLKLLVSAGCAALLCALAGPIASAYGIPSLVWPIRGMAVALFGQSMMLMTGTFVAMAQVRFALLVNMVESAVEVGASVALVLLGAGVTGAAFGRAIGYLVGGAMTVVVLWRLLGPAALPRGLHFGEHTRRIASYASFMLIIDGAVTLFNQVDILIIGAYLSASAVGIFSAPLRLIAFLAYPASAVSSGISPRVARNRWQEPNVGAMVGGLRLLLIMQTAITAFILGWSPLIVRVALGPGYAESAEVLRALAPFVYLSGFGVLASISANYLGAARKRVPIAVAAVLINVVIDLILVPRIGVIGGAVGTDAAYALYAPGHLIICQRILKFDLLPLARTLMRTLAAGAVMTAILLLVDGSREQAWLVLVGGVAAVIAFAAGLWITRELTPAEAGTFLEQLPLLDRLPGALRRVRRSWLLWAAPLLVVMAIVGFVAGHASSGGASAQPTHEVTNGLVSVDAPAGWRIARTAPRVPGLETTQTTVVAPDANADNVGLVIGEFSASGPSPLPAALLARIGTATRAEVVTLENVQAYQLERVHVLGSPSTYTFYVIPGSHSSSTVLVCYAAPGDTAELGPCEQTATTLSFPSPNSEAQTGDYLTPDPAYARSVGKVLERVDHLRASLRPTISANAGGSSVAAAANELSTGLAGEVEALAALQPPPAAQAINAALLGALSRASHSYAALASAVDSGSSSAYSTARSQIGQAEAQLSETLRGLALIGYR